MLDWYGPEGMSSEDSEVEDGYLGARVKVLPWRRDIRNYLDYIDRHRFDGTVYSNYGSKPMPRTRRKYIESSREAVTGLPRSFYDQEWLGRRGDEQATVLINISKVKFAWKELDNKNL